MATFNIKRGARLPILSASLGVNVTGNSGVTLRMRPRDSASGAATISGACSVVTAATGAVEYAWADGDTATAGVYDCEFVVSWGAAGDQVLPADTHVAVVVFEALT